jgi:type IV secretory pathway VirB4 component
LIFALRFDRRQARRFLPWAALIAPGVVLNKDGAFQRTLGVPRP